MPENDGLPAPAVMTFAIMFVAAMFALPVLAAHSPLYEQTTPGEPKVVTVDDGVDIVVDKEAEDSRAAATFEVGENQSVIVTASMTKGLMHVGILPWMGGGDPLMHEDIGNGKDAAETTSPRRFGPWRFDDIKPGKWHIGVRTENAIGLLTVRIVDKEPLDSFSEGEVTEAAETQDETGQSDRSDTDEENTNNEEQPEEEVDETTRAPIQDSEEEADWIPEEDELSIQDFSE